MFLEIESGFRITNGKDREEQESIRILDYEAYFCKPNSFASNDRVIFKKRLSFCYVSSLCLRKSPQKVLPVVSTVSGYAVNTCDNRKSDL